MGEVLEGEAALLTTRFDQREHRFDEPATLLALCAEAQFAPDHRVPQRSFACIVRRFDAFGANEFPEPRAMLVQLPAHADDRFVAAGQAATQVVFRLATNRGDATLQGCPRDFAVAVGRPVLNWTAPGLDVSA